MGAKTELAVATTVFVTAMFAGMSGGNVVFEGAKKLVVCQVRPEKCEGVPIPGGNKIPVGVLETIYGAGAAFLGIRIMQETGRSSKDIFVEKHNRK